MLRFSQIWLSLSSTIHTCVMWFKYGECVLPIHGEIRPRSCLPGNASAILGCPNLEIPTSDDQRCECLNNYQDFSTKNFGVCSIFFIGVNFFTDVKSPIFRCENMSGITQCYLFQSWQIYLIQARFDNHFILFCRTEKSTRFLPLYSLPGLSFICSKHMVITVI